MRPRVVGVLIAAATALTMGCGDNDDSKAASCAPVPVGDGNRAVDIRPTGIDCDQAHRIARESQDQTEPDYMAEGFHCMGEIDFGPNQRVREVAYRCERGDESLRFVVDVG